MEGIPSYEDKKFGSMVRGALWLVTVVGEGNVFTKTQLREAFPDIAQIDRRLRDLRDHGWRIDTSRDDPSLLQQEQRFVTRGADVWIPGRSKAPKHKASLTAAQRAKAMHDDNYLCRSCGIGAGEAYEDGGGVELAKLNVARRRVLHSDGTAEYQLVTECKRCGTGGGPDREVDLGALLELVEALAPLEQRLFAKWIDADQRSFSPIEKVWGIYRTLPQESRAAVAQAIDEVTG
ncbi:hypothetical protein SLINC_3275 [Streptomyces lincolnensis]|uniref:Uncharacterized protein n=1 Tax=Streptomyces lincolnensis TaxID=1915 RepID=A0A1B1MA46_STRLN|nr:hypothetical protein [Streptomyces lincolnensis]ANS65499.1 hypothetical protein SLINC_3275 [Streptomyces lincolnensis]AXG54737.1 hypothetical protein SLCG_3582 [Streptomyces lincolnensis]QMV09088.1 hypothetical protein GJU35_27910 [Streptomyces lincolnensis]